MRFLNSILQKDADFARLYSAVATQQLPLAATGLSRIHKAIISAALARLTERRIVLITHDEASANELRDDLVSLGMNALNLPSRDYNLTELRGFSREYEQ